MLRGIWFLMIALTVVHQIDWGFSAEPLVGDVIPPGLMFHAGISVAAALFWALIVTLAWPRDAEVEILPESDSEGHA